MTTMVKSRITAPLAALLMLVIVAALYGPFINNPPFFDDDYFFHALPGSVLNPSWSHLFDNRSVSTGTLALTYRFWAYDPGAYRIGNLFFHFLTSFSLFLFVRDLLADERKADADLPAFGAALLFALHPVAAFAVGYIVERSIILAGLFSLWMWIAVHRGVRSGNKAWLLLSAGAYLLAVYSKEHAATALPVALLIAWNAADGDLRKAVRSIALPFVLWAITAGVIILQMKHVIGTTYEPLIIKLGMVDPQTTDPLLLRSSLNQSALFFQYMLYWLVPNGKWLAIDVRVPFPPTWFAWPWIIGLLAFPAYGALTAVALWRGFLPRLVGIALMSPWLLFLTSFGAVLYQEPFVLYRSYLWALPGALLVAVLLSRIAWRAQLIALTVLGLIGFASTWSRLQVFSDPVSLWTESADRLGGRDDLPGAFRIYKNRGVEYAKRWEKQGTQQDMLLALADFSKAILLSPKDSANYINRGQAYLAIDDHVSALADFNSAVNLNPADRLARFYRGVTLLDLGHQDDGLADLACTCSAYRFGCDVYAERRAQSAHPM